MCELREIFSISIAVRHHLVPFFVWVESHKVVISKTDIASPFLIARPLPIPSSRPANSKSRNGMVGSYANDTKVYSEKWFEIILKWKCCRALALHHWRMLSNFERLLHGRWQHRCGLVVMGSCQKGGERQGDASSHLQFLILISHG